jgi:hypothetical protein
MTIAAPGTPADDTRPRDVDMTNLASNLAAAAARDGGAPAIRFGDTVVTFAQLDAAISRRP